MHRWTVAILSVTAWVTGLMEAPGCRAAVMLGAHVGYASDVTWWPELLAFESAIGRQVAIDSAYDDWVQFPSTARASWDIRHGRTPMLSWRVAFRTEVGCATADAIVKGVYDTQLDRQAAAIKSAGGPVMIRFNYEMTDNAVNTCFTGFEVKLNPTLAGEKYILAWRHVVTKFRLDGVTNAVWVWAPGGSAYENGYWSKFYPGSAYVDWIAVDEYNKLDSLASFADDPAIAAFYANTAGLGKPLMISETGAVDDPAQHPDAQSVWIATARLYIKANPAIAAFVYWDDPGEYYVEHPGYGGSGYVLQGRGLDWFRYLAADPWFNAPPLGKVTP